MAFEILFANSPAAASREAPQRYAQSTVYTFKNCVSVFHQRKKGAESWRSLRITTAFSVAVARQRARSVIPYSLSSRLLNKRKPISTFNMKRLGGRQEKVPGSMKNEPYIKRTLARLISDINRARVSSVLRSPRPGIRLTRPVQRARPETMRLLGKALKLTLLKFCKTANSRSIMASEKLTRRNG